MSVTSVEQAFQLCSNFAKSQFETLSAQSRELAELGQKVSAEAAEPFKAAVSK